MRTDQLPPQPQRAQHGTELLSQGLAVPADKERIDNPTPMIDTKTNQRTEEKAANELRKQAESTRRQNTEAWRQQYYAIKREDAGALERVRRGLSARGVHHKIPKRHEVAFSEEALEEIRRGAEEIEAAKRSMDEMAEANLGKGSQSLFELDSVNEAVKATRRAQNPTKPPISTRLRKMLGL